VLVYVGQLILLLYMRDTHFFRFCEKQTIVKEIMRGIIQGLWTILIPDVVLVMVNMKLNSK
jgi:hypothetical protein